MTKTLLAAGLMALATTAFGLWLYHQRFAEPPVSVAVVDIGEIMRAKEQQYAAQLTKTPLSEADRQVAATVASEFAAALPAALREVSDECRCVVFARGAVIAAPATASDLTARVRQKLGLG